jgi:hypothetical protein
MINIIDKKGLENDSIFIFIIQISIIELSMFFLNY